MGLMFIIKFNIPWNVENVFKISMGVLFLKSSIDKKVIIIIIFRWLVPWLRNCNLFKVMPYSQVIRYLSVLVP